MAKLCLLLARFYSVLRLFLNIWFSCILQCCNRSRELNNSYFGAPLKKSRGQSLLFKHNLKKSCPRILIFLQTALDRPKMFSLGVISLSISFKSLKSEAGLFFGKNKNTDGVFALEITKSPISHSFSLQIV